MNCQWEVGGVAFDCRRELGSILLAEWVAGDSHIFILAQCKGAAPLKILRPALIEEPAASEVANLNASGQ